MYAVTEAYQQAIRAPVRTERLRGTLTLTDGTVRSFGPESLMSGSVTLDTQCVNGQELEFGCVYLGQASFQLRTDLSRYKLYGARVSLTYGLQLPDGSWADLPLGVYTVAEAERTNLCVSIHAYDNLLLLDRDYTGPALQGTPYGMLSQIAEHCGLELGVTEADLAGQPNAGKSSLLNALAGAELAIVTPIAGTTRDKVSETIQIEGVPLKVIDTAGLRAEHEASDEVERIGMARSWEAIGQADVVLFLHDLTRAHEPAYAQADADIAQRLAEAVGDRVPVLHVFNKADAAGAQAVAAQMALEPAPHGERVALSARTGEGLEPLRHELLTLAGWQHNAEGVFIARQRHVQALREARGHLEMAQLHAAQADGALDLLAEELRLAHDALGRITGAFSADDLLGEIFSRFCIGK